MLARVFLFISCLLKFVILSSSKLVSPLMSKPICNIFFTYKRYKALCVNANYKKGLAELLFQLYTLTPFNSTPPSAKVSRYYFPYLNLCFTERFSYGQRGLVSPNLNKSQLFVKIRYKQY